MRILYLAQKPVGESGYAVVRDLTVGIVSNSKPVGWWRSAGLASVGVPFVDVDDATPERLIETIERLRVDGIVTVQYPRLLPSSVLSAVANRAWNLHLAPLPRYRGYNGPTWAILRGDATYGSTLHWMDENADTGDIAYVAEWPIPHDATAFSLYAEAERQGLNLLAQLIEDLRSDREPPRHPQTAGGTYWTRVAIEREREITTWDDLDRKARAFHFPPYPPAHVVIGGRRLGVAPLDASVARERTAARLHAIPRPSGSTDSP